MTQRDADLPVKSCHGALLTARNDDFHLRVLRNYDRTIGQCVRADRRQDQRMDRRIENRPAGGQRIGGGPGGRGHDQTVTTQAGDQLAIDPYLHLDHAGQCSLAQDDII